MNANGITGDVWWIYVYCMIFVYVCIFNMIIVVQYLIFIDHGFFTRNEMQKGQRRQQFQKKSLEKTETLFNQQLHTVTTRWTCEVNLLAKAMATVAAVQLMLS